MSCGCFSSRMTPSSATRAAQALRLHRLREELRAAVGVIEVARDLLRDLDLGGEGRIVRRRGHRARLLRRGGRHQPSLSEVASIEAARKARPSHPSDKRGGVGTVHAASTSRTSEMMSSASASIGDLPRVARWGTTRRRSRPLVGVAARPGPRYGERSPAHRNPVGTGFYARCNGFVKNERSQKAAGELRAVLQEALENKERFAGAHVVRAEAQHAPPGDEREVVLFAVALELVLDAMHLPIDLDRDAAIQRLDREVEAKAPLREEAILALVGDATRVKLRGEEILPLLASVVAARKVPLRE